MSTKFPWGNKCINVFAANAKSKTVQTKGDRYLASWKWFPLSFCLAVLRWKHVPIWTLKLSSLGPRLYLYGKPLVNSLFCWHGFKYWCYTEASGQFQTRLVAVKPTRCSSQVERLEKSPFAEKYEQMFCHNFTLSHHSSGCHSGQKSRPFYRR